MAGFGEWRVSSVRQQRLRLGDQQADDTPVNVWLPSAPLCADQQRSQQRRSQHGVVVKLLVPNDDASEADQQQHSAWLASHGLKLMVVVNVRMSLVGHSTLAPLLDWVATQDWCNGRVSLWGSNGGADYILQAVSRLQPRPALQAVVLFYQTGVQQQVAAYEAQHRAFVQSARPPTQDDNEQQWRQQWLARLGQLQPPAAATPPTANATNVRAACLVVSGSGRADVDRALRLASQLNANSRVIITGTQSGACAFDSLGLAWCSQWLNSSSQQQPHNVDSWPPLQLQLLEHRDVDNDETRQTGTFVGIPNWREIQSHRDNNHLSRKEFAYEDVQSCDVAVAHVQADRLSGRTALVFGAPTKETDHKRLMRSFFDCQPMDDKQGQQQQWLSVHSSPLADAMRLCGQPVVHVAVNRVQPDPRRIHVCLLDVNGTQTRTVAVGQLEFGSATPAHTEELYDVYIVRLHFCSYLVPNGNALQLTFLPAALPTGAHSPLQVCLAACCVCLLLLPASAAACPIPSQLHSGPMTPMISDDYAVEKVEKRTANGVETRHTFACTVTAANADEATIQSTLSQHNTRAAAGTGNTYSISLCTQSAQPVCSHQLTAHINDRQVFDQPRSQPNTF